jgi:hypothetical protein
VWELFAGSIAAFIVQKRGVEKNNALALLGLSAIVFSIFAYDNLTPFPSIYALVPVVGVVLVLLYGNKATFAARLLSTKLFVGLGLISYSAYLWHQPLFAFARIRLIEAPSTAFMLMLGLASIVLAVISWKYVEQPFRNKKKWSRKFVFSTAVIGGTAFISFGLVGHYQQGWESRYSEQIQSFLSTKPTHRELGDDGGCNGSKLPENCSYGAKNNIEIALVGDSHASALAIEIGNVAAKLGKGVVRYTKNNCPLISGFNDLGNEMCDQFVEDTLNKIDNDPMLRTIIVVGRYGYYVHEKKFDNGMGGVEGRKRNHVYTINGVEINADIRRRQKAILLSFRSTVQKLSYDHPNKKIIVLTPIPEHGWHVPQQLAKRTIYGLAALPNLPISVYQKRNAEVMKVIESFESLSNVTIINAANLLCVDGGCLATKNGTPLYYDDDHVSKSGASLIANSIRAYLK